MVNNIVIDGRITGAVKSKNLDSGSFIISFDIAHNKSKKVNGEWEDDTHFFSVSMFTKSLDFIKRLNKGVHVIVQGELKQDRWIDKDGGNRNKVCIFAFSAKPTQFFKKEEKKVDDVPF